MFFMMTDTTDDSSEFARFFTDQAVLDGVEGSYQVKQQDSPPKEASSSLGKDHGLPPIIKGGDFPPSWELESRPYLIDKFFQRGDTILLSSPPKCHKSFFWGNIAVSLGTGTPFLGMETTQSNVLIIDLELRRDVAMDRLINIAQAKGFDKVPDSVFLWSLARHTYDLDTICEVLNSELLNLPKMDLVIVDPLYVIDRGTDFDENNAHSVTRLITALERLTTEQDSALGLVHHCRKGNLNNADAMDRTSGSSAFSRYPSVIMNLSRHEQEDCSIIESVTRNFRAPPTMCLEFDAPLIKERPDLDITKYRKYGEAGISKESTQRKILHSLPLHPIEKQEWYARCREFNLTETDFLSAVKELLEKGSVEKTDKGFIRNKEAPF